MHSARTNSRGCRAVTSEDDRADHRHWARCIEVFVHCTVLCPVVAGDMLKYVSGHEREKRVNDCRSDATSIGIHWKTCDYEGLHLDGTTGTRGLHSGHVAALSPSSEYSGRKSG
jgi:hypothetical protein